MTSDVYERLAQKLNATPNGFPRTQSGVEMKILKKIFTKEEAEIAVSLKLMPQTPEQIAQHRGRNPEGMGDILEQMVKNGEIGGMGPLGARMYHFIPFIVGIGDFQLNRLDREESNRRATGSCLGNNPCTFDPESFSLLWFPACLSRRFRKDGRVHICEVPLCLYLLNKGQCITCSLPANICDASATDDHDQ